MSSGGFLLESGGASQPYPAKGAPAGPPQWSTDLSRQSSPPGSTHHGRAVDGGRRRGRGGNQYSHRLQVAGARPARGAVRPQFASAPQPKEHARRVAAADRSVAALPVDRSADRGTAQAASLDRGAS